MIKPKLSLDEQILDMQKKGITFQIIGVDEAKKFLRNNNYYFKLKSYERDYEKYRTTEKKGQYINLDFAYLKELSILDMYLRKLIISMALDLEHALKVQIVYDLSRNDNEDGYSIVKEYLDGNYMRVKTIHDRIGKSVASDLIQKRKEEGDQYALWEIVEVLSFGDFVDLYQLYYSKYPKKGDFCEYLWSVKFMRNAAAHNNCILNSLRAPYNLSIHKTKGILFEVSKIKTISEKSRETWMKNPVVHDFIVLVFVYLNIIKSKEIKQKGIGQLEGLFENRMIKHKEYFEKNVNIKECYLFTRKVVETFCHKYRK